MKSDDLYDVLVVGTGAGGIGAAVAAGMHGARVLLLERLATVGGTAGPAGVCHWEAGIGGTGVPIDIYERCVGWGPDAQVSTGSAAISVLRILSCASSRGANTRSVLTGPMPTRCAATARAFRRATRTSSTGSTASGSASRPRPTRGMPGAVAPTRR